MQDFSYRHRIFVNNMGIRVQEPGGYGLLDFQTGYSLCQNEGDKEQDTSAGMDAQGAFKANGSMITRLLSAISWSVPSLDRHSSWRPTS